MKIVKGGMILCVVISYNVYRMAVLPGDEVSIYCEKDSHKGIIIGKGGSMLKRIGTYARKEIENFFGIKVSVKLWVKVKEDWRNRQGLIHTFGLD